MNHVERILVSSYAVLGLALGTGAIAAAAIDATHSPAAASIDPATPLGQPFALVEGEAAIVDGRLTVRFSDLIEDSRCPTDVQCVWEGNAAIAVEVSIADSLPATLCLNTNPRFATAATYASYSIELLALDPYPSMSTATAEPFRAALIVTGGTGMGDRATGDPLTGCAAVAAD
jgi:hypothetical protein